jgi:ketopantoate hydroxymethyltransferase
MAQTRADGVKLEGGEQMVKQVAALVNDGTFPADNNLYAPAAGVSEQC